jgi:hypothetical protein
MRVLQPADNLIAPAVNETLNQLDLSEADAAAAALAKRYAAAIDEAINPHVVLDDLGPKLLAVLESLGATPKARAAIQKGASSSGQTTKLSALRAAR